MYMFKEASTVVGFYVAFQEAFSVSYSAPYFLLIPCYPFALHS